MKLVFAHNVYDRFVTLKNTIDIENRLYPDSKICVAYNDELKDNIKNIKFIKFNEKPHKIGCVNGCILSIQTLLTQDFDVLIFSHDDVSINENYTNIVNKNINSILNNEYDIICRTPLDQNLGTEYYMMEVFYISKNAALKLFGNLNKFDDERKIPTDKRGSISPEVWLYDLFKHSDFKIKEYSFKNDNLNTYNKFLGEQMGYNHKNIGLRGWKD